MKPYIMKRLNTNKGRISELKNKPKYIIHNVV